jgi:hypothetical protein
MASYSDSQNFLEEIVRRFTSRMEGLPVLGQTARKVHPMNGFVNRVVDMIKKSFSPERLEALDKRVAFGALESAELNAFIIRSECRQFFAVLLNYGLILFLFSHSRLTSAWGFPESAYLLVGQNWEQFTRMQAASAIERLCLQYKESQKFLIPPIRFSDPTIEIGLRARLLVACTFTVGHELGHFFNGDLDREELFAQISGRDLASFDPNPSHAMELAVDAVGFDILMCATQRPDKESLLFEVGNFFTLLKDLGIESSDTHPAPHARVAHLAKTHFNDELAEGLDAYYRGDAGLLERYGQSRGRDWVFRRKP